MKGITAVLTLGVVLVSVGAQAEPFTKKVVKRIVNQEITRRAASLRGPAGPSVWWVQPVRRVLLVLLISLMVHRLCTTRTGPF